jgi:hypothetical protein
LNDIDYEDRVDPYEDVAGLSELAEIIRYVNRTLDRLDIRTLRQYAYNVNKHVEALEQRVSDLEARIK